MEGQEVTGQQELDDEMDVALLKDLHDSPPESSSPISRWHLIGLACSVLFIALALYWFEWGRPGTVLLEQAAVYLKDGVREETVPEIEERLLAYVDIHPEEVEAWSSLMAFQWYAGKREAFRRSHSRAEANGHFTRFGDSLYLLDVFQTKRLELNDRDQLVRNRLREEDPSSQVGSLIDALESTARNDFLSANKAWEAVLSTPDLFELHHTATIGQLATRARLEPANHPNVSVDIALNDISADKRWIFIYARADMQGPPLAVVKRPLTGLRRIHVVLDDSVVMRPDQLLSTVGEVTITARLSTSADALEQEGDLSVSSRSVKPSQQEIVELDFGQADEIVKVKLASKNEISPVEPIFIIVKKRAVSTPIAVRRIYGALWEREIAITTTDLMLPNISPAALQDLEVKARLAKSQLAVAQPGDIESDAVSFSVGDIVELALSHTVGENPTN